MSFDVQLESEQDVPDGRGHARRRLHLEAVATGAHGVGNAVVLNLSESGLLLETQVGLAPDDEIEMELPHAGRRSARVVWASSGLAGCQFDRPIGKAAVSAAVLQGRPLPADGEAGVAGESAAAQPSFGTKLRELRRRRGMSLVGLAQLVAVSKPTVWNWEKDKARPRPEALRALARVLRVSEAELLVGADEPPRAGSDEHPAGPDALLARVVRGCKEQIAEIAGVGADSVEITIRY